MVWFSGWRDTPIERHLYRVPLTGGEIEQVTTPGGWHDAVQITDAFQEPAKPFEMMTYPGKRHRIVGEAENTHLWTLFLNFFDRNLKQD